MIHCSEMCYAYKGTRTRIIQTPCGQWQQPGFFCCLLIWPYTKGTKVRSQDRAELAAGKVKHSSAMEDAMGKFIISDEAIAPIRSYKIRCL